MDAAYSPARKFSLPDHLRSSLSQLPVVLLDTSVWIRLADARTPESIAVRDLLLRMQGEKRLFCPLCEPVIWELRRQVPPSVDRTVELMDALSCNVTFRSIEQLFDAEVRHFVRYLLTGTASRLTFDEIFGPLLSYLGDGFRIDPPQGAADRSEQRLLDGLEEKLSALTVTQLVQYFGRMSDLSHKVPDRQLVARNRRHLAKGSIERARRVETEYFAGAHLLPRLRDQTAMLTAEERLVLHRQLHTLPRSRRYKSAVEHILQHMPAMSASVEAQTLGGLDITRATHENDFQDLTITTLAFCYTSTFAAIDRWIKSILVLARDQQYPTGMRFAGSLSELRAELDALA